LKSEAAGISFSGTN